MQIALLVPYFGSLPVWFPAFLYTCKFNPGIDWFFFTDCEPPVHAPRNVHFRQTRLQTFCENVADRLGVSLRIENAYKLCDLRPMFGHIFEKELEGFDFWGHCDVDVVWGNIRSFITDDVLESHDIISSRKGILAGHFGLYRNRRDISQLYQLSRHWPGVVQSSSYFNFDENGISEVIRSLIESKGLRVYWPSFLLNFHNEVVQPSRLAPLSNCWFWKQGRLFDQTGEESHEVMYLHFMTWKNSLKVCYFGYDDEPTAFYISYSHIGKKTDVPPFDTDVPLREFPF